MKERVDTFQVGPAAPGQIGGLVEDVTPAVLLEARKTDSGRNTAVKSITTVEGNQSIAHVYIEYTADAPSAFNFDKQRTVVTEHHNTGIYAPI